MHGAFACALDILEYPANLCSREVRVDDQTCLLSEAVGQPPVLKLVGVIRGAAALPDYRVADRLTRHPVPDYRCLALVGDAYGCDLVVGRADVSHGFSRYRKLSLPYLVSVVLYPSGLRKILGEFLLHHRADIALAVKEDTAVRGRARVERHDVLLHNCLLMSYIVIITENAAFYLPQ